MNKTAELVKLWAEYEAGHSGATIEDFCHFHLVNEREKKNNIRFAGSGMPPDLHSILAKMVGRIVKLHSTYAMIGLKECGINNMEDFLYLSSIQNHNNPRKTQVIYSNFSELSSGLLILDRLKAKGWTTEEEDPEDKRSKRLTLTKKGGKVLMDCFKKISAMNAYFFKDMPRDDIRLCTQLLAHIETKFSNKWMDDKGKSFDELK